MVSEKTEKTLYEYCKEIATLYELESQLFTLGIRFDDEIEHKIIDKILYLEEELRNLIKGGKL